MFQHVIKKPKPSETQPKHAVYMWGEKFNTGVIQGQMGEKANDKTDE